MKRCANRASTCAADGRGGRRRPAGQGRDRRGIRNGYLGAPDAGRLAAVAGDSCLTGLGPRRSVRAAPRRRVRRHCSRSRPRTFTSKVCQARSRECRVSTRTSAIQSIDELDFDARQKILRLVIEKVTVSGWRVEIHLKIPLTTTDPPQPPPPTNQPSNDMRLCSTHIEHRAVVQQPVEQRDGEDGVREDLVPLAVVRSVKASAPSTTLAGTSMTAPSLRRSLFSAVLDRRWTPAWPKVR